jgi:lysophospholipase L1-like esterase
MHVCFLGESFVNGTGDRDCLGWAGRICQAACQDGSDLTYYNLGIRRETSTELAERWLPEVQRRLPDDCDGRVVFSFGVNDTTIAQSRRVQLSDSLKNLHQILSVARSLFPVLMIGPPPISDIQQNLRIAELSKQMAIVSQNLGVPYLEIFSQLKESQIWTREVAENDGAHPREAGYAEFTAIVQKWNAWSDWFH